MNGNNFTLPQTKVKNERLAAQARKKRAVLLTLVPQEFTSTMALESWDMPLNATNHQIQMMTRYKEIEPTSTYKKPRTYRKVNGGAST